LPDSSGKFPLTPTLSPWGEGVPNELGNYKYQLGGGVGIRLAEDG